MGTLTENYNILNELGRGGMGAVYLATDKRLDRKVAIKILQLSDSFNITQKSEIINRFQKEARAVAKLSHPNIVGIHDIGEDNNQHYMVMEFLEGKSIGSIIESEGSMPIDDCINISIQMCKALEYIHANSIVHRDIKPDNIIILNNKKAKLTDFGIAQNDSEALRLTQDGAILGSIMYISPEQLRNSKDVDNRADIYSYGVTLYQMLTGQLPFNGDTVGEVVAKILSEHPELPRKLNPSIPYELEAIVMKAMNKSIDKRYKAIEDMERDLQNLLATHSFKKTTVSNKPVNTEINNKTSISNTIYNNTSTNQSGIKTASVVIEKADNETKLIRIVIKLVIAIAITHICYSIIFNMIGAGMASEFLTRINNSMIQGPYSQYMIESKIAIQSSLYSLLAVIVFLIFSGYSFPIESKGVHRNFKIGAEIIPAVIVLIITGLYTFLFVAKTDTMKKYVSAYNQDLNSEISDFDSLIKQKGALSYSEIDNYKKSYRLKISGINKIASVYSDAFTQIRDNVSQGDHIKLNVSSTNKVDDPNITVISDLLNNVFSFNDPSKEIYVNKVNQLLNVVSGGLISSLPEKSSYKVSRDPSTNKVDSVNFEWEKNNLILKNNSAEINLDGTNYKYPKVSDKLGSVFVENSTDKNILFILYSSVSSGKVENIIVQPGKKEEVKIKDGSEYQAVVMSKDKSAIPFSTTQIFNNDDSIKIDKVYYDNNDYYSINEKSFPNMQTQKMTKADLKSQNIFFTNDADIIYYNLVAPKKK